MPFFKKSILILSSLVMLAALGLGVMRLFYGRNPLPIVLQALPIPSTLLGPQKGYVYAKEAYRENYIPILSAHEAIFPPYPFAAPSQVGSTLFPEIFVVKLNQG